MINQRIEMFCKKYTEIENYYKGLHMFNNGVICICCFECPDGFVPGRLKGVKNEKTC